MNTVTISERSVKVRRPLGRDEKFFFIGAIVMAAVLVAGFALNLAMGRSTFASPIRFHIHAFLFFGWTALFVTQNTLAATGSLSLHRRLGWLATVWAPLMVVSGIYMTVADIRGGRVPPFFAPAYFLVMNPLQILCFAGLVLAAITQRRRTQWHRRLMFCAMAAILGPGFGRLLPMPLLIPWAGLAANGAGLLFPIAGVIRDLRKDGAVHPAWWWGIGAMLATTILIEIIVRSTLGLGIYEIITQGAAHALPPYDIPMLSQPH